MWGGKCCCKRLSPFTFGLALGVTYGLTIIVMGMIVMFHIGSSEVSAVEMVSWSIVLQNTVMGLLKGFVFGFFLVFFYNLFACCMAKCGCQKSGASCGCGSPKDQNVNK